MEHPIYNIHMYKEACRSVGSFKSNKRAGASVNDCRIDCSDYIGRVIHLRQRGARTGRQGGKGWERGQDDRGGGGGKGQ